MMASANGRPSWPALTTDCGVPPAATQIGSWSWYGLGYTPRSLIGARNRLPPVHPLGFADLQQKIEFLREELVVIVQRIAEERKGFDE